MVLLIAVSAFFITLFGMPNLIKIAKLKRLDIVSFGGDVNPVLKSRSLFPPVIVSTVNAMTSNLAALALSKQESFSPRSL